MIHTQYFWVNIVFLALGTFAIRFSFIAISSKIVITQKMKEVFSFIPTAILPAIIAPAVFFHKGQVAFLNGHERFIILILATFVCYLTRSTLLTILFGLVSLYIVIKL